MIIGRSKFTPGTGTPLQPEMFLIICRQTARQTHRQTDGQTHRQTDMTDNITYSHTWVVISRSCNSCKNSEKKSGKNQLQYFSLEAGIHHFDFLSLYCMNKETLQ